MNDRAWPWTLFGFGIPGLRELVLLALVTLVLYGRVGLQGARHGRGIPPWLSPVIRRTSPAGPRGRSGPLPAAEPSPSRRRGDRLFWSLALIAATAVAAWIVTRTLIVSAPNPVL